MLDVDLPDRSPWAALQNAAEEAIILRPILMAPSLDKKTRGASQLGRLSNTNESLPFLPSAAYD